LARNGTFWHDPFNLFEIIGRQIDINRLHILLQVFHPFCTGDRNDVIALRQHPGQRQLRCSAFLLTRNFFNFPDEIKVLLKVLALKSRRVAAVVIRRKIFISRDLASQKTTP
jgi:hypothetical protein